MNRKSVKRISEKIMPIQDFAANSPSPVSTMSGIGLLFQSVGRTSLKRASNIGLANKAEV
jgi:hypothetical protein